jgi:hypothetical protein
MKYYIIAFLVMMCALAHAQVRDKARIKEQRRLERAERRRVRDSIYNAGERAYEALLRRADSLNFKDGVTEIHATTSASMPDCIGLIAKALIHNGHMIDVDKEYGTIRTEPQPAGMGTSSIYYTVEPDGVGSKVRGWAVATMNYASGLRYIAVQKTYQVRIDNTGSQGSPNREIFKEYEGILLQLPDAKLTYIKEEE